MNNSVYINRVDNYSALNLKRLEFIEDNDRDIENMLNKGATRKEIFMDDEGTLYIVDKGDLKTYWLRNKDKDFEEVGKEKIIENKNPFLD
jgi:hypothetical protein